MTVRVETFSVAPLPDKTLIARGEGEVVVCRFGANGVAVGDGSALPAGGWVPGALPAIYLAEGVPMAFKLRPGDELYAWPVSGLQPTIHVLRSF